MHKRQEGTWHCDASRISSRAIAQIACASEALVNSSAITEAGDYTPLLRTFFCLSKSLHNLTHITEEPRYNPWAGPRGFFFDVATLIKAVSMLCLHLGPCM